ncbi:MAG: hypothetical protein JWM86_1829 [Thermoleophilia bacterium]|nr:hypothetical protein [Thermoleophilia bacterium]
MLQGSEAPAARSDRELRKGPASAARIASPNTASAAGGDGLRCRADIWIRTADRRSRGTPPRDHRRSRRPGHQGPPTASCTTPPADSFRQRTRPRHTPSYPTHVHTATTSPTSQTEDFVALARSHMPSHTGATEHSRPRPRSPSNEHSGRGRNFFCVSRRARRGTARRDGAPRGAARRRRWTARSPRAPRPRAGGRGRAPAGRRRRARRPRRRRPHR